MGYNHAFIVEYAAIANQTAIDNTLKQILPGATEADIEYIFRIEAAKLGAEIEFFSVGTYGGLRNGEIVRDEPLMIDGVSKINGYCGDYGRTFVYGSPSRRVEQRVAQFDAARQAVFEMLKPGVRYSDIQAVAKKAMAGRGLPSDIIARATPPAILQRRSLLNMPTKRLKPVPYLLERDTCW